MQDRTPTHANLPKSLFLAALLITTVFAAAMPVSAAHATSFTVNPLNNAGNREYTAGNNTTYRFSFHLETGAGATDNLTIGFPQEYNLTTVNATNGVVLDNQPVTQANLRFTAAVGGYSNITIRLTDDTTLAAGDHTLDIEGVINPLNESSYGPFKLRTWDAAATIDSADSSNNVAITRAGEEITDAVLTFTVAGSVNQTGIDDATLNLTFTPGTAVVAGQEYFLTINDTFTLDEGASIVAVNGAPAVSPTLNATTGEVRFTITSAQDLLVTDQVFLTVTNVDLPNFTDTFAFAFETFGLQGEELDFLEGLNFTTVPNVLTIHTIGGSSPAGGTAPYTFEFSLTNEIPAGGNISIVFPDTYDFTGYNPASVNLLTVTGETVAIRDSTIHINVPSTLAADKHYNITVAGVRNPVDAGETAAFVMQTEAAGDDEDHVIDKSSGTFTTNLTFEAQLDNGEIAVELEDNQAGADGWVNLTFAVTNNVPKEGSIHVRLPDEFAFSVGGTSVATLNGTALTFGATTYNAHERDVLLANLASGLTAGTFWLNISHVQNAPQSQYDGSFNLTTRRANGDALDVGDNDTAALRAAEIPGLSVDAQTVSEGVTNRTAVTYKITFVPRNDVPENGSVNITFPQGFEFNGTSTNVSVNGHVLDADNRTSFSADGANVWINVTLNGTSIDASAGTTTLLVTKVNTTGTVASAAAGWSGFNVTTFNETGVSIDTNETSVYVRAGPLGDLSGVLKDTAGGTLAVGNHTSLNLTFSAFNDIGPDANVSVTFPAGFSFDGDEGANGTGFAGAASFDADTLTLNASLSSGLAGTVQYINITNVTAPSIPGSVGDVIVTIWNSTLKMVIDNGTISPTGSLGANSLTGYVVSFTDHQAGELADYRIQVNLTNKLEENSSVVLTFPAGFDLSGASGNLTNGTSGLDILDSAVSISGQTVTAVLNAASVPSNGEAIEFNITSVRNNPSSGVQTNLTVVTKTNATLLTIDAGEIALTLDPSKLQVISQTGDDANFTTVSPAYRGASSTLTIKLNLANNLPAGGVISIELPPNATVQSTASALVNGVGATSVTGFATGTDNVTLANVTVSSAVSSGSVVTIAIQGIRQAVVNETGGDTHTVGNIYTSVNGVRVEQNTTDDAWRDTHPFIYNLTVGTFTVGITPDNTTRGALTNYNFTVPSKVFLPVNGTLSIRFPDEYDLSSVDLDPVIDVDLVDASGETYTRVGQWINITQHSSDLRPKTSPSTWRIEVRDVLNPSVSGMKGAWNISINATVPALGIDGKYLQIDNTTMTKVTPFDDEFHNIAIAIVPSTGVTNDTVTLNITVPVADGMDIPANGNLSILVPTGFVLPGEAANNFTANGTAALVEANGQYVNFTFSSSNALLGDDDYTVLLHNVTLPRYAGTKTGWVVASNASFNGESVSLQSNTTASLLVSPGDLNLSSTPLSPTTGVSGELADYTFFAGLRMNLTSAEYFRIVFPAGFDLSVASASFSNGTVSIVGNTIIGDVGASGAITQVQFTVNDVRAPSVSGSSNKAYTIELLSANSTGAAIDNGSVVLSIGPDVTAPAAPTGATIDRSAATDKSMTFNWTVPGDLDIASYVIQATTTSGATTVLANDLTFSPSSLAGPGLDQRVTVTNLTQDVAYSFKVAAKDDAGLTGAFSAATESIKLPNVTFAGSATAVVENDTATVKVALTSNPSGADVVLGITTQGDITANLTKLTFGAGNWSTAKSITVTAGNDDIVKTLAGNLTVTVLSGSPEYLNHVAARTLQLSVTEDEAAALVASVSSLAVDEGGSAKTYTLVLGAAPLHDVNVTVVVSDTANLTATPKTLVFGTGNWSTPKTISVSAPQDTFAEGTKVVTISHTVASQDAAFNSLGTGEAVVSVSIADDDVADLIFSLDSVTVNEGSTTTYTVRLAKQPTASVAVRMNETSADIAVSPATLTFTTSSWNTAQIVTVTGVDDELVEGNETTEIRHNVTSTDADYKSDNMGTVDVKVGENDEGLLFGGGHDALAVLEQGATTDTFTLRLSTKPTDNVTVTLNGTSALRLSTLGVAQAEEISFNFTTSNWATTQTIVVRAVDDAVFQGAHTANITVETESDDNDYDDLDVADLVVSITDNDFFLTPTQIQTENGKVTLVVQQTADGNVLTWTLPSNPAGTIQGVQVWAHNSPYTLLATYEAGSSNFTGKTFTHTGATAKLTTTYLVTLFFDNDVGFFATGTAPDSADYNGTAVTPLADDTPEDEPVWKEWWFWLLIVLAVLVLAAIVVLIVVLMRRRKEGGGEDDWDDGFDDEAGFGDDDGFDDWEDEPVQEAAPAPAPVPAPVAPAPKKAPVASGETHHLGCPRCGTKFEARGSKPLRTTCPKCHAVGLLK